MPDTGPTGGEDARLVVALHGYGGTAADMIRRLSVAANGEHAVVVVGPDGPHHPELAPAGRAWYPITSQESLITRWSQELVPGIVRYVEREQRRYGVPAQRTALVGFSQGVSVATAVLARSRVARRAVFVCGRVLGGDSTERTGAGAGDVLVVTGGRDRFVRQEDVRRDTASGQGGVRFAHVEIPGLGHEFNNEVARLAVEHTTQGK